MSQSQQGSRTSGLCRGTRFGATALEPEHPVPASSLRKMLFGTIVFIAVLGGLASLIISSSKEEDRTTYVNNQLAAFPKLFQKVQQYDQQIATLDRELASIGGMSLTNSTTIAKYYQQLTLLQEMKINRARCAEYYNCLVSNLVERNWVTLADFQKAGLPPGIQ